MQHLHHGNPGHRAIVCKVLTRACTPIYVMLTQWLLDGALEDPHHEFFIAADPTVSDDRLWQDKYSIRCVDGFSVCIACYSLLLLIVSVD